MILKPSEPGGLFSWHRVIVVGANGAGKTWFACRLHDISGLPIIHNDALALTQGWVRRPGAEVEALRDLEALKDRWIMEGGPSVLAGAAVDRAQLVVWLDVPPGIRVRRILWRSVRYLGQNRPEHPPGNRDWPGLRQWRFLTKAFTGDAAMRAAVERGLIGFQGQVMRLRHPRDVADWLSAIDVAPDQD